MQWDVVPALGAQRGLATLSQPRCVSGAIYKLKLHKFGTEFFSIVVSNQRKKGTGAVS